MQERINEKFRELRTKGRKALIAFVTAGYPDLNTTVKLVAAFEQSGADIIELGVPFSDPLADGPTIQRSSAQALAGGVTINKIFSAVRSIREKSNIPIVLMTYYNPVFKHGTKNFLQSAQKAGVDGITVPDLPFEEAGDLIRLARKFGVATIFFASPTTTTARLKKIARASTGFIYYVALTGVTGTRSTLPADLIGKIRMIKRLTDKPVCAGFGISQSAHVKKVARVADGVIIGSAIIKEIQKNIGKKDLISKVSRFVGILAKAAKA